MRAYVLALFFLTIPFIAKAQQFDGYQAFEILTQAERRFSGGSVSYFKPDGTFVFTHSNGYREEGTYTITQSGVVRVNDTANRKKYQFVIGRKGEDLYFTYRSGPGRGKTYTFQ
ncbi:MAG: hypothetical protein HLUCCA05_06665 [Roseibaca calidilacus]|jgi:hypothetical protein|uniref:Uncharacterized protein n=1 Tax=Roseibaca calidilacus TaxID=1666912 RepID=A0A0P7YHI5_9RHOB|nr:hypothetical protein [Roseibaca calidilacus]KPP89836.1 MAG: hypothetical protein HLUCCA05_06665 [Roseibaca calidilacus]CUX80841.1 hypothetical protein Ga0058931_1373 [Roseibaca calidilacus]